MPTYKRPEPTIRTISPATGKSAAPNRGQTDEAEAEAEALTYSAPTGEMLPPMLEVAGDEGEAVAEESEEEPGEG